MKYVELIQKFRENLLNINAEIITDETNVIVEKNEVEYYEGEHNIIINSELFNFYNTINGIQFNWKKRQDDLSFYGYLNFGCFEDIIERETEDRLWVDWYQKEDIKEIKTHFLLEHILGTDSYVTMKIDDKGDYKLYYVPEGGVDFGGSKNLAEIPLSFEQYFYVVINYYGLDGLRSHLHKDEFYTKPFDVYPQLRKLEKIFPDFQIPVIFY